MPYPIQLQTLPSPQPTAVVRRRADLRDLPKIIPDACGAVWNMIRALQIKGAGRHIALYLDNHINLEIGVEMESPITSSGELIGSSLPTGPVATTAHFGSYQQLANAHDAIRDWCAKNGHTIAGPNWEVYGHWEDDWNKNPLKVRTDLFYLLKQ
jgi:effector-binding domain-containing protein